MSDRKVFIIAHNKSLKGVVSNKQILWNSILHLLNVTEEELDSKEKCLKISGMSDADMKTKSFTPPTSKKVIYKSHYLYHIFKEHKNVLVLDAEEHNRVTIYERNLNEVI